MLGKNKPAICMLGKIPEKNPQHACWEIFSSIFSQHANRCFIFSQHVNFALIITQHVNFAPIITQHVNFLLKITQHDHKKSVTKFFPNMSVGKFAPDSKRCLFQLHSAKMFVLCQMNVMDLG